MRHRGWAARAVGIASVAGGIVVSACGARSDLLPESAPAAAIDGGDTTPPRHDAGAGRPDATHVIDAGHPVDATRPVDAGHDVITDAGIDAPLGAVDACPFVSFVGPAVYYPGNSAGLYAAAGQIGGMTTADLDGDGRLDLVTVGELTDPGAATGIQQGVGVRALHGRGDGTFSKITPPADDSDSCWGPPTALDVNGDGFADLLFEHCIPFGPGFTETGVQLRLGRGDGSFAPPVTAVMGSPTFGESVDGFGVRTITHYDAGDGGLGLIACQALPVDGGAENGDPTYSCFTAVSGNGAGVFSLQTVETFSQEGVPYRSPVQLGLGDLNADGFADLIVEVIPAMGYTGVLQVFLGQAGGGYTPFVGNDYSFGGPAEANPPVIADFTSDGIPDVLLVGGSLLEVFPGKGDGRLGAAVSSNSIIALSDGGIDPFDHSTVADLDGDGALDLVLVSGWSREPPTYLRTLAVARGNGDGTFGTPYVLPVAPTAVFGAVTTGDFDGDGRPDIAVGGSLLKEYDAGPDAQTGAVWIFLNRKCQ